MPLHCFAVEVPYAEIVRPIVERITYAYYSTGNARIATPQLLTARFPLWEDLTVRITDLL